jgi:hypothetical protein
LNPLACRRQFTRGARAAFIEAGFQPASVDLRRMQLPTQYFLPGDANYPFDAWDADPVNYRHDRCSGWPRRSTTPG